MTWSSMILKKRVIRSYLLLILGIIFFLFVIAPTKTQAVNQLDREVFQDNSIQIPFGGFITNCGQVTDDSTYYFYQNNVWGVYFKESSILFHNKEEEMFFTVQYPGAAAVQPIGMKKTNQFFNYFLSDFHMTNVATYDEIWYYDLYQGIDLRYYMSSEGLKYEFIVHPRGNPAQIAIQLSEPLIIVVAPDRITAQTIPSRAIVFEDYNLHVFQADGTAIGAQFTQHQKLDRCYGIIIDNYDATQKLIIDPLITYSTYLGGDGVDYGFAVAVDSAGNAYVTGRTESTNLPIKNAYQTNQGAGDVFITKLNATGNGLVYSTYLGGNDFDHSTSIAIDSVGNVYVTGWTHSSDFPTQNPYQTNQGDADAFVTKLNATGNGLVYSTYLGGDSIDEGWGIAVDSVGNTYVGGNTESSNFPIKNPYQTFQVTDVFITKLNATGNGLLYSTYLSASSSEYCHGMAVDSAGNAYITGKTTSSDFPIQNPYQTNQGGDDVFVTKLNATGNGLIYSTYLGGNSGEEVFGIVVDSVGNAYIAGNTESTDFPTQNPYQTNQGGADAFVTKLNATGNGLVYSTYLGGDSNDEGADIAVDSVGNVYIPGWTYSTNYPTQNAYQSTLQGGIDVFVTKLNVTGNGLFYSTYLGGDSNDEGSGIAVDSVGNVYVTGWTHSTDFPNQNAYQTAFQGVQDVFVTYFPHTVNIDSPIATMYATDTITVSLSGSADHFWYSIGGLDLVNQSWTNDVTRTLTDGIYTLHAYGNDSVGNEAHVSVTFTIDTATPTIPSPPQDLQGNGSTHSVNLSWEEPSDKGSSDLLEYNVYRSTSPSNFILIANTTSTDFVDTTVTNGLTYFYVVTAVNSVGESNHSNMIVVFVSSNESSSQQPQITPAFSIIYTIISVKTLKDRRKKTKSLEKV